MTEDERIFLARFEDKAEECSDKSMITNTKYMDMHMRSLVAHHKLPPDVHMVFYSFDENDERVIAVFLPEYIEASDRESLRLYFKENQSDDPIRYIRIEKDRFSPEIEHRDYLGSVMGLGITREMIGDIYVDKTGCSMSCLETVSDFIVENLIKAGRSTLTAQIQPYYNIARENKKEDENFSFTVSSVRLDSIIKNGFNLSRGNAVKAIEQGLVYINDLECLKPDKKLTEGDKIVFRHRGRFIIQECSTVTKKGRIIVICKR